MGYEEWCVLDGMVGSRKAWKEGCMAYHMKKACDATLLQILNTFLETYWWALLELKRKHKGVTFENVIDEMWRLTHPT